MMEPTFFLRINGMDTPETPLSKLPVEDLKRIVAWRNIQCTPDEDADFNRRYAAILLKERGVT